MEVAKHEATIRERAYAIWEEEGRPVGCELQHWHDASQAPRKRKPMKSRIRSALKSAMPA